MDRCEKALMQRFCILFILVISLFLLLPQARTPYSGACKFTRDSDSPTNRRTDGRVIGKLHFQIYLDLHIIFKVMLSQLLNWMTMSAKSVCPTRRLTWGERPALYQVGGSVVDVWHLYNSTFPSLTGLQTFSNSLITRRLSSHRD